MIDVNLLFGYFGNVLKILLLLPLLKWILWAILGSITLYIVGLFVWDSVNDERSIFNKILFSMILSPIIEESLYRYLVLGIILYKIQKRISFYDFLIFSYIAFALLIPGILFYTTKLVSNKPDFILLVFVISIPVIGFGLQKLSKKGYYLKKFLDYYVIFMVAMLFFLSHNVFASQSQFIGGIFFGFLYYKSRNILPPITAHFVYNLLVAFKPF